MSDEKKPSDYDRMSLTSLKRELEVQKAKTAEAREEAHGRIAETKKPSGAPWGLIGGIAVVAILLLLVGGWFGRSFIASVGVPLPEWAATSAIDAGTFALPEYQGLDAGPEPDAGRSGTRRPHKNRDPGEGLDFGNSNDPIDGLDELP